MSGKSYEREVKICKNDFSPFIFHSSFHYFSFNFFPSLRFLTPIPYLWLRQRSCFVASNITFHTTKHGLWRSETIPLANSFFVNRPFTDINPCNYMSISELRKTSKNGIFSTEWPFRCQHPLFFGVKIRILFDKIWGCQKHQIKDTSLWNKKTAIPVTGIAV